MLTDLAFHLAEVGHEVHVICSRQLYEFPESKLVAFETVRGVQAHRASVEQILLGVLAIIYPFIFQPR